MRLYLLLFALIMGMSCKEESKPKPPILVGQSDEEARLYLETFLHASNETRKSLSASLRPTEKDIETVFEDTVSQRKVREYLQKVFEEGKFSIAVRREHQELKVWSASVADFKNNAIHALTFPSAFMGIIDELNETLTFHRFKFVQEGFEAGAAYDGLVKVNNHWAIFPKIWKAFEELEEENEIEEAAVK